MKANLIYDFIDELKALLALKDIIQNGMVPDRDINLFLKATALIDDKMLAVINEFEREFDKSESNN